MQHRSKKNQKLYESHGPQRNLFLSEFGYRCAIGGRNCLHYGVGVVFVHEIIGGPSRMRAFVERAAWLPACNPCNGDDLTDRKLWPVPKQLAIKLDLDPEWFDLDKINELIAVAGHPNPPRVVTGDEVLAAYVAMKRAERQAA